MSRLGTAPKKKQKSDNRGRVGAGHNTISIGKRERSTEKATSIRHPKYEKLREREGRGASSGKPTTEKG